MFSLQNHCIVFPLLPAWMAMPTCVTLPSGVAQRIFLSFCGSYQSKERTDPALLSHAAGWALF